MYLPYNAPHNPIQPPEEFLKRYRERHPDATEKRALLAAFIEHLDAGVGRVLEALETAGVADDTLVIAVGGFLIAGKAAGAVDGALEGTSIAVAQALAAA